ncbi:hypothetical protein ACLKA6_016720 [Drosophila palustris]
MLLERKGGEDNRTRGGSLAHLQAKTIRLTAKSHMRNCGRDTPTNKASKIKSTEWRAAMEGRDNASSIRLSPRTAKGFAQNQMELKSEEMEKEAGGRQLSL